jgi:hypothetical protein
MRILGSVVALLLATSCGGHKTPAASTAGSAAPSDKDPKVDEASKGKTDKDTQTDEADPNKSDQDKKTDEAAKQKADKDTKVDESK